MANPQLKPAQANLATTATSANRRPFLATVAALLFVTTGCHRVLPVDTTPLDDTGMSYDSIQQLQGMKITSDEVPEIAKARHAGFSDAACVEAMRIFHSRSQNFHAGDAIVASVHVGFSDDTILEFAKLNQLGFDVGELQAMRLAGLSDGIILEVARHHADGKPVFSGASLADLKNAGLGESTLLELARRGLPDSQAEAIVSFRHHGANDAEILRRFTSS
jgi:hypothetical protein